MATNKDIIIAELKAAGITNQYSIAAILAIIDKESGFKPQTEISYKNTSNANIRNIPLFKKQLANVSDADLTILKKDEVKFFNKVYNGIAGNSPTEGFSYRGRGFNQLTGKGNYQKYGEILGLNLVNNPDLVNDPKIAAKVAAAYFVRNFKNNAAIVKARYGANNINDFKDTKTAVNAFYNANAGFGKDTSKTITEGKTKALKKVDSFLTPGTGLIISLPLIFIGALIFYYLKK
jgi:predicted chitinase